MSWQSRIKTKKDFKLKAIGKPLYEYAFEPGPFPERRSGTNIAIEGGPNWPIHTWYANVDTDEDGIVVKIR